jgi:hypothetical protein
MAQHKLKGANKMKTVNITGIGHVEIDTNEKYIELAGEFVNGQAYHRRMKQVFNNRKYDREAEENGIRYYLWDHGNDIFTLEEI